MVLGIGIVNSILKVLVLGIGIVKGHPKVLVLGIVKGNPKVLGIGIGFEFLVLSISGRWYNSFFKKLRRVPGE